MPTDFSRFTPWQLAEMLAKGDPAVVRAAGDRWSDVAGSLYSRVGDLEHTHCHNCRAVLVERYGYFIQNYRLTAEGACPDCGTSIPGRWARSFVEQITATPFLPGTRRLRTV